MHNVNRKHQSVRAKRSRVVPLCAVVLVALTVTGRAWPSAVEDITITPKYETAGIIVRTESETLGLEIFRQGRGFQPAHAFIRYDRFHLATSLFGLTPDTPYKLRIGGKVVREFRTKKEFVIPAPRRIVRVSTMPALQEAVNAAHPGTTILVSPGTYRGQLIVRNSGTAGNPIVIRGDVEESAKPAWRRSGLPAIDAATHETGILIEDAGHVVLDSLQVRNADKHGVYLLRAGDCVVQRMQIYDNGTWNLIVSKGGEKAGRHLIQHNHVADLEHGKFRFDYRGGKDVTYYGIIQDNQGGWGTTIRGNRVEGHVDGISPSGDEHDLKKIPEDHPDVLSTWINREVDVYDNIIVNQRDDAIEADGVCVNLRIFRNLVRRAQNATSISPIGPGPVFIVRNVLLEYNESGVKFNTGHGRGIIRNVFYYHNTFVPWEYNRRGILTIWAGTPSKNIVFRNNIFTGDTRAVSFQGLAHRPDMDYDLWHAQEVGEVRSRFEDAGLKWETHGLFADPRLTPAYHLKRDSPAIDKGIEIPGINDGWHGKKPDLGAYELLMDGP
jgi:hypothetical protein